MNRRLELTAAGRELYHATDEALGLIEAVTRRLASPGRTLAVTTTTSLASLWLAPRLADFVNRHPGIDVNVVAVNDMARLQLEPDHLDLAIRFVPPGWDIPGGERLVDYSTFPVCAPALAQDPSRPLRVPSDLEQHVLLDFERMAYGNPWSDWDRWFSATRLPRLKPASVLRFSHYDQVIQATLEGTGVAIGKRPHLTRHMAEGRLVAPFGQSGEVTLGSFYIVFAQGAAQKEAVVAFVDWLRRQVQ